jgi:hypothetical protein
LVMDVKTTYGQIHKVYKGVWLALIDMNSNIPCNMMTEGKGWTNFIRRETSHILCVQFHWIYGPRTSEESTNTWSVQPHGRALVGAYSRERHRKQKTGLTVKRAMATPRVLGSKGSKGTSEQGNKTPSDSLKPQP